MSPFIEPYDATTPSNVESAAQGDDRIRELKRSLTERIEQGLAGFPDIDSDDEPISARVLMGTAAARPATPFKSRIVYMAIDTRQIWVADSAPAWVEMSGGGGGGVDPNPPDDFSPPTIRRVTNFSTCAAETPTYSHRLEWTNTETSQTRVYRDGVLITTVNIGVDVYTFAGLTPGTYNFQVRHVEGTLVSAAATLQYVVTNPCSIGGVLPRPVNFEAVNASACVAMSAEYAVNLTWVKADPSFQTEILRDGELIFSTSGAAFTDTGITAPGQYVYQARHINTIGSTSVAAVDLALILDPCAAIPDSTPPSAVTISDIGSCNTAGTPFSENVLRIRWTNPPGVASGVNIRVYRWIISVESGYTLQDELILDETQYLDGVPQGQLYRYVLRAWDGVTEGPNSQAVELFSNDLCTGEE